MEKRYFLLRFKEFVYKHLYSVDIDQSCLLKSPSILQEFIGNPENAFFVYLLVREYKLKISWLLRQRFAARRYGYLIFTD